MQSQCDYNLAAPGPREPNAPMLVIRTTCHEFLGSISLRLHKRAKKMPHFSIIRSLLGSTLSASKSPFAGLRSPKAPSPSQGLFAKSSSNSPAPCSGAKLPSLSSGMSLESCSGRLLPRSRAHPEASDAQHLPAVFACSVLQILSIKIVGELSRCFLWSNSVLCLLLK